MKKPSCLYHGSGSKLKGQNLIPNKANDLGTEKDNTHNAIYASDNRKEALAMAVLSCKGISCMSLTTDGNKIDAIIYKGSSKQEYIYLYTLKSNTFKQRPPKSHQWVSFDSVKPIKIEKLKRKDYFHLVRNADEEEKVSWFKKYGDKIVPKK